MVAAILSVLAALAVATPALPAPPTHWVEDHAGFLSPATRTALDHRLEAYEQATGHQVIVWIGQTIGDADLADWAVRTFAAWKVGREGIDDGVAVFILAQDRTIDIEVGYGLEGQVPDAIASRIIREVMLPRIRAGDRDGAVTAGVDALLASIEGKPWQPGTTAPTRPTLTTGQWIGAGIVGVLLLILFITHPRFALLLLWTIAARGGGGLFGGGGGGGFGGGGGRSGGGGARGSW